MNKIATLSTGVLFAFVMFATPVQAQVYYQDYTPRSQAETIAYLQGILAQLIQQQGSQVQYTPTTTYYPNYSGQVLGASYNPYNSNNTYSSNGLYNVVAGTSFVRYDNDDDITLNGTIDLNHAPYGYMWFEYGENNRLDSNTTRRQTSRSGSFSTTVRNLERNEAFSYRAVTESPSGVRDYGVTRYFYISGSSNNRNNNNNDDEPDANTDGADDVDEDSAELNGDVDMNDFNNGVVFFVYGEDEDQIEDVERDYDSYSDVDTDGDDLRKVRVDTDLDGDDDYSRRVTSLDDDTRHYYQICVEYEDDDDDDVLECGGVEDFETDRD